MNDGIISLAQLEEDLQEREEERNSIIAELDSMFEEAEFMKAEKLNTISYGKNGETYKAMFSIDNTTYNYTCYISDETGEEETNFSLKGPQSGIISGAQKFINLINSVT